METLLANNLRWAASKARSDPAYFRDAAHADRAEIFWIGCCDCAVPVNEMIGVAPGLVFVHRNVANQAPGQDMNFLAALDFALDRLGVGRIIVCGHYGCAGIHAALSEPSRGLVEHWLQPLRGLSARFASELDAVVDLDARTNHLCERNVAEQVAQLAANPLVHDAWRRGQNVSLHGLIFSRHDGLLRDMEVSVAGFDDSARLIGLAAPRRTAARRGRKRSSGEAA